MIFYPTLNSRIKEKKQLELLSEWGREIQTEISNNPEYSNLSSDTPDSASETLPEWKMVNGEELLGSVRIDAIGLTEPIVRGTKSQTLLKGAGTVLEDRLPGQPGNFVLAGHRSWTLGRHFNRLGEVRLGDRIDVETTAGTYRYIVNEINVVMPDDLSVLEDVGGKSVLTLITCEPIRKATHRLIVKAELLNTNLEEISKS